MDKIGNFLDSVSSFFTCGDKFPWSDKDDILECERELGQALNAGSEELEEEKKLRYTCALLLSQETKDVQAGITSLEEEYESSRDMDTKKLFLLAFGYYRNKDWSKIRQVFDHIDPPPTSSEEMDGTSLSQYLRNYEQLKKLGKGGFGRVKICKHKLDGREYAVKIIQLKYREEISKILLEVRTLSKLEHQHVVRYFHCWLEMESPVLDFQSDSDATEIGDFSKTKRSDAAESGDFSETKSGDFSETKRSDATESGDFSETKRSDATESGDFSETKWNFVTEKEELKSSYFFIQMELCTRTLRGFLDGFLDNQKVFDATVALRLSCQIIDGLAYIHRKAVIHRDINPNNIFLDSEDNIKIGDFGLARFEPETGDGHVSGSRGADSSEKDAGTSFYKAPESAQLMIDQKMDMFSFGIVLFELWHPFCSGMERFVVLTDLVKGNLPSQWQEEFPVIASIVTRLMGVSEERPSASDVQTELLGM